MLEDAIERDEEEDHALNLIDARKLFGLKKSYHKEQKRKKKGGRWQYEDEVQVQRSRQALKDEAGRMRDELRRAKIQERDK